MEKACFLLILLTLFPILNGCSDDETLADNSTEAIPDIVPDHEIIKIPVVVHVITFTPNPIAISDQKIQSQITVLNQDFRKKNSDWTNTPDEFIDLVADVGIEFYLATKDPEGQPTNGIIRSSGEINGWDGRSTKDEPIENFPLYFTSQGGQDAWPNDKYLNIWIADLSDIKGGLWMGGYAHLPGCDPRMDGVVIDPRVFGTLPPLKAPYTLGRTATHEIGHWLNLHHVSGKEGSCNDGEDGDYVDDTPLQCKQYRGKPSYPQYSCGTSDMFMNFMDRVDDQAMYMFTKGQKQRMRNVFNKDGLRRNLYLNIRE